MNLPRPKNMLRLPLTITMIAGLAVTTLSGCGEEPPPPPPPQKAPPPPPPPPPPELSLQALLQEMKSDARVSFADAVKITDESLARSVINLADGFARGDATKLRPILDGGAQNVLGLLDASGEWSSSTSTLEAVRVVFIGNPGDAIQTSDDLGAMLDAMGDGTPIGDALMQIPLGPRAEVGSLVAGMSAHPTPEQIEEITKKMAELSIDPGVVAKITAGVADLVAKNSAESTTGYSHVVALALQDERGAFLLGWGVGPEGRMTALPSSGATKPRASDFDAIGSGAFRVGGDKQYDFKPDSQGEKKAEEPAPTEPGSESEPGGPKRKSTPGGPVTIPGSGGS